MSIFFIDMMEMVIPISILIGVLLLISPLIKKSYVAKWRYFMWLFIAVRLIIPFKINMFNAPITMEIPNQIQGLPVVSEPVMQGQNVMQWSLQNCLTYVWFLGVIVFVLYQIICYFSFKNMVKRWAKPVDNKDIECILSNIKNEIGEKRRIDIKICKIVSTPMVFGVIKPVLLLPGIDYNESELRAILNHELIHFRRNDIYYKLILVAANAINWFNPLVYMMVSTANRDVELVCDAEVVKEKDMEFRRHYCHAILKVVHNKKSMNTPLSTCFIISKKVIKERFGDILDVRKKRKGRMLFAVVSLSVIISGSLVTFATERVADKVEDELQIIERPEEKPKQEEREDTEIANYEDEALNTQSTPKPNNNLTEYERQNENSSNETADNYVDTNNENIATEPISEVVENDSVQEETTVEDVSDESTDNKYESLGEPDDVSTDGSKETYNLDNGDTVILQYEDNELDTGYILVE